MPSLYGDDEVYTGPSSGGRKRKRRSLYPELDGPALAAGAGASGLPASEDWENFGKSEGMYRTSAALGEALGVDVEEETHEKGFLESALDVLDSGRKTVMGTITGLAGGEVQADKKRGVSEEEAEYFNSGGPLGRAAKRAGSGIVDMASMMPVVGDGIERAADSVSGGHLGSDNSRYRATEFEELDHDKGDSFLERAGKSTLGFGIDVVADPLTYLTLGTSVVGKKAAAELLEKVGQKQVRDELAAETNKALVEKLAKQAIDELEPAKALAVARAAGDDAAAAIAEKELAELLAKQGMSELDRAAQHVTMRGSGAFLNGITVKEGTERTARVRAGSRGLRTQLVDDLGADIGEKVFAKLPRDIQGGARFRAPFMGARYDDAGEIVSKGVRVPFANDGMLPLTSGIGGGGRVFGTTASGAGRNNFDRSLDLLDTGKLKMRASGVGQTLGKHMNGVNGDLLNATAQGALRRAAGSYNPGQDLDYAQMAAMRDGRRAVEYDHTVRAAAAMGEMQAAQAMLGQEQTGVARTFFNTIGLDRNATAEAAARRDTLSAEEAIGLQAAERMWKVLDDVKDIRLQNGLKVQPGYSPLVITEDALKAHVKRNKTGAAGARRVNGVGDLDGPRAFARVDQTPEQRAALAVAKKKVDEARAKGEDPDQALLALLNVPRFAPAAQANEVAEKMYGIQNMFETDPFRAIGKSVDSSLRQVQRTRLMGMLADSGVLVNTSAQSLNAQGNRDDLLAASRRVSKGLDDFEEKLIGRTNKLRDENEVLTAKLSQAEESLAAARAARKEAEKVASKADTAEGSAQTRIAELAAVQKAEEKELRRLTDMQAAVFKDLSDAQARLERSKYAREFSAAANDLDLTDGLKVAKGAREEASEARKAAGKAETRSRRAGSQAAAADVRAARASGSADEALRSHESAVSRLAGSEQNLVQAREKAAAVRAELEAAAQRAGDRVSTAQDAGYLDPKKLNNLRNAVRDADRKADEAMESHHELTEQLFKLEDELEAFGDKRFKSVKEKLARQPVLEREVVEAEADYLAAGIKLRNKEQDLSNLIGEAGTLGRTPAGLRKLKAERSAARKDLVAAEQRFRTAQRLIQTTSRGAGRDATSAANRAARFQGKADSQKAAAAASRMEQAWGRDIARLSRGDEKVASRLATGARLRAEKARGAREKDLEAVRQLKARQTELDTQMGRAAGRLSTAQGRLLAATGKREEILNTVRNQYPNLRAAATGARATARGARREVAGANKQVVGSRRSVRKRQREIDANDATLRSVLEQRGNIDSVIAHIGTMPHHEAEQAIDDLVQSLTAVRATLPKSGATKKTRALINDRIDKDGVLKENVLENPLMKALADAGWHKFDTDSAAFQQLTNTFGPEAAYSLVAKYTKAMTPQEVGAFRDALDTYMRFFRPFATVLRPGAGFIMRNIAGGAWNNHLIGVNGHDLKLTAKVVNASIKANVHRANLRRSQAAAGGVDPIVVRDEYERVFYEALGGADTAVPGLHRRTWKEVIEARNRHTGLGQESDYLLDFAGDVDAGMKLTASGRPANPSGKGGVAGKVGDKVLDNTITRFQRGANGITEEGLRTAAFISGMRKYKDDDGTLSGLMVKVSQFDYGDLTDFEKNVMRNILPFYTWTRKNLPLQLRALMHEPGKVNRFMGGYSAVQGVLAPEEGDPRGDLPVPEFVADKLGTITRYGSGDSPLTLSVESPLLDLNKSWNANGTPDLQSFVSGANPLLKTLTEGMTGVNSFTKQPFENSGREADAIYRAASLLPGIPDTYKDEDGRLMAPAIGVQTGRNLIPVYSTWESGIMQSTDESKARGLSSRLSQGLGLPVTTASPRSLSAERRKDVKSIDFEVKKKVGELGIDYDKLRQAQKAGATAEQIRMLIRSGALNKEQ